MDIETALVVVRDRPGDRATFGLAGSLVPVANKAVVLHTLEGLRACGIRRVTIAVDASIHDAVRSVVGDGGTLDLTLAYVQAVPGAPQDGLLQAAEDFVDTDPYLIHDGDALLHGDLASTAARFTQGRLDALAVRLAPDGPSPSTSDGNPVPALAGLGACFLRPSTLAAVRTTGLELPRIVAHLRESGACVEVEHIEGCVPGSGREALLRANSRALQNLEPSPPVRVVESEIRGPVAVHPTASIEQTVIGGPAVIGPRAFLSHAYVGPYTSIGADVVVEGAEVEYSVLLDGASVRFLGDRLHSSVVGRNARVGRDFRLPHAVRIAIADGGEVTFA